MNPPRPPAGIVVLAHTPPPHHGQSLMVALMLDMLKAEPDLSVYHVDCRYSDDLAAMGKPAARKFFLAVGYALRTLYIRFKHGAEVLYYIPAPGKRPAFWRDCLILSLVRPFFPSVVFHWHAAGLSSWLEYSASALERMIGKMIFRDSSLSIVLVEEKASEVTTFHPREIRIIPNGIPDPCPDFTALLSSGENRPPSPIKLLFLSAATREKGVFTAVNAWQSLNERTFLRGGPYYQLTIAGDFPDLAEKQELEVFLSAATARLQAHPLAPSPLNFAAKILGPVYGLQKASTYAEADIFLFPSTSTRESFGVVLVEAAHFGLPCVSYQPLVGPTGLSLKYHRRVSLADEAAFIEAIASVALVDAAAIRADAREKFNLDLFGIRMKAAFREVISGEQPE